MKELSKSDREIITLISNGATDYEVCRKLGLLPDQLERSLQRVAKRAEAYDAPENAALFYERALRRRAEHSANSLQARFNALLQTTPDAILVVDALTGIIHEANENAAQLFGYEVTQLIGASMERLVPERYRTIHPAYRAGFLSSFRKREMGYHPPIFGLRGDGSEIEVAIALTASVSDTEVMVVCSNFAQWKMVQEHKEQEARFL